jgi:hemerythrin-like domain-containing protein
MDGNHTAESASKLLADHHRELEDAYRTMLSRTNEEAAGLMAAYQRFERALLEHLEAEEETMLAAYAEYDPDDARRIRSDHARIRRLLVQIGIDDVLRTEHLNELVTALRSHETIEDSGLYRWADANLSLANRQNLDARIRRSLQALAGHRPTGSVEHTGYAR